MGATDDPKTLNEWLAALPCDVELPAGWEDYFNKRGVLPTFAGDVRRFPRFHARGRGALECPPGAADQSSGAHWRGIFTKDISRSGLGLLHSEQLYPPDRLRIVLADGICRRVEVVHCRRIQRRCYEIGATFVSEETGNAATASERLQ